eukprot:scaffold183316_cov56-Attheya_sp.AAC.2
MPRPPGSKDRSKRKRRSLTENEKKSFREKLARTSAATKKKSVQKAANSLLGNFGFKPVLKPEVVHEGSDLLVDDGAPDDSSSNSASISDDDISSESNRDSDSESEDESIVSNRSKTKNDGRTKKRKKKKTRNRLRTTSWQQEVDMQPHVANLDEEDDEDIDNVSDDTVTADDDAGIQRPSAVMHTYLKAVQGRLKSETSGNATGQGLNGAWLMEHLKGNDWWLRKEKGQWMCAGEQSLSHPVDNVKQMAT